MTDQPFDRTLDAARAGEGWALAELFRDLHPRFLRYLGSLEPEEAEDLASDTWLDVARGLERFRGDEHDLRAFAFTIARRRLMDLWRTRTRRNTESVEPARLEAKGPVSDVEDEALAELGTQDALDRIIRLPAEQAEVVLLRVLAGLSVDEVAILLSKRPGTIRVIQHRALRRLAREASEEPVTK